MELDKNMPETVAPSMPSPLEIAACRRLPDSELNVYAGEYERTGFQGGLDGDRIRLTAEHNADLQLFANRTVDVPSIFIGGKSDWGVYQTPGAFESMQKAACTRTEGVHLVEGAGHWVQQEQFETVAQLLVNSREAVSADDGLRLEVESLLAARSHACVSGRRNSARSTRS